MKKTEEHTTEFAACEACFAYALLRDGLCLNCHLKAKLDEIDRKIEAVNAHNRVVADRLNNEAILVDMRRNRSFSKSGWAK